MRWVSNAVIGVGLLVLAYAAAWQLGIAPGSRVTLPEPVALSRTPTPLAVPDVTISDALATRVPTPGPTQAPAPAPEPTATPIPVLPVAWIAPDAADRAAEAAYPAPGYAVRLAIPAIKLDTQVKQAGIVPDAKGNPIWQTLPFVAVHYGELTSLVGADGNAVIAGHVVTLNEGNVFRFLYQVDIGDEIQVWDQRDKLHTFTIRDVKLVLPTDVSVMEPTPDPTLTLITCGGSFDPIKREFSHRLIVTAKRVAR